MSENNQASRESRLKQRWAVRDEAKLYYILQLVFAAAQIVAAYAVVWENNFQLSGIVIFAVLGALLLLLALSCWQNTAARVIGRAFSAVLIAFFLFFCITDTLLTGVTEPIGNVAVSRSFGDYLGQFSAYLCLYIQALLLVFYPAFLIAVKREEKTCDIVITRVITCVTLALSIITFALSFEDVTRIEFSAKFMNLIPNSVMLVAYCLFGVASVIAVMMAHPYGVDRLKAKIDALKRKGE